MRYKKKGDTYLSYSPLDKEHFSTYSVGYAISDHIAINSGLKSFGGSKLFDNYVWDNELVVYNKWRKIFYPSINFGVGFGELDKHKEHYDLNIRRLSIVPSFGMSNDFFDLALSARFSKVNYDLHLANNIPSDSERYYDFQDVGKKSFYFVEPALTAGIGYKIIKFRGQYVLAEKLDRNHINYYKDPNIIISANLTLNIYDLMEGKNPFD
ncbi:MAG: hypothetical protein JXR10_15500 [Cyclobacteriaceae bacterium]